MPEIIISPPEVRCLALEVFSRRKASESSKTRCLDSRTPSNRINCGQADSDHLKARKGQAYVQPFPTSEDNGRNTKTRGRGARTNPNQNITANDEPPTHPASRKPGSSIYYGVRFRPDLNKWVAEIRVAEWKVVDKKVWLGTFDTEEGAARGVDLARKLLKCTKKHPYNLPCDKLDAYSGHIPSHLILTDVTTNSMFKAATQFIKRECQEYACSFDSPTPLIPPTLTPDHHNPQFHFHPPSPPVDPTRNQILPISYETNSIDSDIPDVVNDYSDSESCITPVLPDYYVYYTGGLPDDMITINDYSMNDCYSFGHMPTASMQTVQSQLGSSPSSCTSTTSCVTLDQQGLDVADWEMSGAAAPLISAGFGDGSSVVTTSVDEVEGAVSQEYWAESLQQCAWPGPGSPESAFVTLPDSHCEEIPYMSYANGSDITPMDCDDWSTFQGVHYPFQHSSNGWC